MEELNRKTTSDENIDKLKLNGNFLKEKKQPNYPIIFGVAALIVWFIQVINHLLKQDGMYAAVYSIGFIIGSLFGAPIYYLIGAGVGTLIRFIINKIKK